MVEGMVASGESPGTIAGAGTTGSTVDMTGTETGTGDGLTTTIGVVRAGRGVAVVLLSEIGTETGKGIGIRIAGEKRARIMPCFVCSDGFRTSF
jgi:hypothetical protein